MAGAEGGRLRPSSLHRRTVQLDIQHHVSMVTSFALYQSLPLREEAAEAKRK